jgi:hypothetical protein
MGYVYRASTHVCVPLVCAFCVCFPADTLCTVFDLSIDACDDSLNPDLLDAHMCLPDDNHEGILSYEAVRHVTRA